MCLLCRTADHEIKIVVDTVDPSAPRLWKTAGAAAATPPAQGTTDTVPGSTASSATVAVGGSVQGVVNSNGDQDWYAVSLTAGTTYRFNLDGTPAAGQSAISDPYLRLLSSTGSQLAFDDDGGPGYNSQITFTPTATGTYFLSAQGFGSNIGGYTLTAAELGDVGTPWTVPQIADQLLTGYWGDGGQRWAPGNTDITFDASGLTAPRADLARLSFQLWSDVTGLTFTEVTGGAEIVLDDADSGAYCSSSTSGSWPATITGSFINVQRTWDGGTSARDSYTLQTFIHEIGHALGLGHAGNYNGSASYGSDNLYVNDSWQATIMSYFSQDENTFVNASYRYVLTPMMADIYALAQYYGPATNTRTGDTVYGFNSNAGTHFDFVTYSEAPALTLYDSGGIDTLDASGYAQDQRIDLTPGAYSNIGQHIGNVGIYGDPTDAARSTIIENAIGGSGADVIVGNDASNSLSGGAGRDTLTGGLGDDTLDGGQGDDLLDDGQGRNRIFGGAGLDVVILAGVMANWSLTLLAGVYTFTSTLDGSNVVTVSGVEIARFSDGDQALDGGSPGPVSLSLSASVVAENATAAVVGTLSTVDPTPGDTHVYSFASNPNGWFSISGNVLSLGAGVSLDHETTPSVTVGVTTTDLLGNTLTQTFTVTVTDVYEGPTEGADTLTGTSGADTIDALGGDDLVQGLAGADTLTGGAGDDTLDGGSGRDTLIGGADDDTYVVDDRRDVVVEQAGGGTDTVTGGIQLALTSYAEVENAALTGSAALRLTGNALANVLTGNDGANRIDGGGGDDTLDGGGGADQLTGGLGADRFVFTGAFGADQVRDFAAGPGAGDVLVFEASRFADFAAVLAATTDIGSSLRIDAGGGDSVTLRLRDVGLLAADDFQFV